MDGMQMKLIAQEVISDFQKQLKESHEHSKLLEGAIQGIQILFQKIGEVEAQTAAVSEPDETSTDLKKRAAKKKS